MSYKKIGILGDIHTSHERLETALNYLHQEAVCDLILCVGDIVDGPDDAEVCCELLREDPLVVAVSGNHDRWCLQGHRREPSTATQKDDLSEENVDYLDQLPVHRLLPIPQGQLLLFHGDALDRPAWQELYGGSAETEGRSTIDLSVATASSEQIRSLLKRWADASVRWFVLGHKHRRLLRCIEGHYFLNPGAFRHGRSYDVGFCVLDLQAPSVTFYDMPQISTIRQARHIEL